MAGMSLLLPIFLLLLSLSGCECAEGGGDGSPQKEYPIIFAAGDSTFDVGFKIGEMTKSRTLKYLNDTKGHWDQIESCLNSNPDTKKQANVYLRNLLHYSPHIEGELRGLALGLGISLRSLLLLNADNELSSLCSLATVDHCSDIMVKMSDGRGVEAHNEDNDESLASSYIVVQQVSHPEEPFRGEGRYEVPMESSRFVSFNYPGQLSGVAFGFSTHGFGFTCNSEFPKAMSLTGVPINGLSRALFDVGSIDDAVLALTTANVATGFSINLFEFGETSQQRIVSVEVAPGGLSSVRVIQNDSKYFRANQYRSLNVEQTADASSIHRLQREQEMPSPLTFEKEGVEGVVKGMFDILGDTADAKYPIYRDGKEPDTGVITLATALFNLKDAVMEVYTDNPKTAAPVHSFNMRTGELM
eukprot:CAMPEP_0113875328 /NCGR_PEP_ID=MMETSP0780_2-20120614/4887_1 /TAXON_ID=652834 /ORGANISM="Palpitomonas bilix" /LENGTH=414 /DNA_ID=CAMNT_0000861317 /DNA_START=29 /DNA_END=1273 /DNA_ORIENTATION=- /assembly_acc=CAM_ASM_000599